jgi:NADH-quinone oxidoreductase subunit C
MDEQLKKLADHIAQSLPDAVSVFHLRLGELTLETTPSTIIELLTFLRDDAAKRFDVVYHLLSLKLNQRVRLKVATDESTPVPSAALVYSAASWFEREAYDLYGIWFADHPDLRRILTDYGFEGHPLRKDFPLTGFVEVRWDDEQKRVVYEAVKLTQEFRSFDFLSPWEGAQHLLPGDEKAKTN